MVVGRVTLLDRSKVGSSLTATIQLAMDRHTPERFASFENRVRACPEVQACYLVAGQDADYWLKVACSTWSTTRSFAEQDHAHRRGQRRALELRHAQRDRHDRLAARASVAAVDT